jgi:hypothetical protein
MKRIVLSLALALSALAPSAAPAQVDVQINIGLPVAPPLVVVEPGVQVVEDYDDEVFVTGGWYWARRGPYWYRARTPQATFVRVQPRYVPARLVRIPPGRYKHWHKERVKAERRAWKEHEKAEKRAWKAEHGHGHGRGH